jgi:hypothetical protein
MTGNQPFPGPGARSPRELVPHKVKQPELVREHTSRGPVQSGGQQNSANYGQSVQLPVGLESCGVPARLVVLLHVVTHGAHLLRRHRVER